MALRDTCKADQFRWAAEHDCPYDEKGYLDTLALNLFQPMTPATEAEFSRGSGGELRTRRQGRQPKMHALHSSSVLACNVFDYWRATGLGPVGEALGIKPRIDRLTFETQFPTGLRGNPSNIDVALWLDSREVWAIE